MNVSLPTSLPTSLPATSVSLSKGLRDTLNSGGSVSIVLLPQVLIKPTFYEAGHNPHGDYYKDCPMCWQEVQDANDKECVFCEADLTPPKLTNNTDWE